jgi:hypothetical protein
MLNRIEVIEVQNGLREAKVSRASLDGQCTGQAWDWASIAATYMTWRGCRYRRLFWGLIK